MLHHGGAGHGLEHGLLGVSATDVLSLRGPHAEIGGGGRCAPPPPAHGCEPRNVGHGRACAHCTVARARRATPVAEDVARDGTGAQVDAEGQLSRARIERLQKEHNVGVVGCLGILVAAV